MTGSFWAPNVAIEVAIYRMGNGPGAKIPETWERKWKMAPRPKWPKNGRRNGKMDPKMGFWPDFGDFFHFGGHLSAISGVGPFSIFFPIFPGFLLRAPFPILVTQVDVDGPNSTSQHPSEAQQPVCAAAAMMHGMPMAPASSIHGVNGHFNRNPNGISRSCTSTALQTQFLHSLSWGGLQKHGVKNIFVINIF